MQYTIPTNAVITAIDSDHYEKQGYNKMEGLCITTDKGSIKLLIDNQSCCCETWGAEFLETPDDISKHIGATLLSVEAISISSPRDDDEEANETQLRITTSAGIIQYAVYNSHNGYYSHATFLQVFDTTEKGSL